MSENNHPAESGYYREPAEQKTVLRVRWQTSFTVPQIDTSFMLADLSP
jgi:hypothetical protein